MDKAKQARWSGIMDKFWDNEPKMVYNGEMSNYQKDYERAYKQGRKCKKGDKRVVPWNLPEWKDYVTNQLRG